MSVVIIIGGTGRLKSDIDAANQAASQNNWTQPQKDYLAGKFAEWSKAIEAQIQSPQPPP
jgi:hypothetical protein